MGYYVNPVGMTKEAWLMKKGEPIIGTPSLPPSELPKHKRILCLVNNTFFSALGIMYNDREFRDFIDPNDLRSKKWYLVNTLDLQDPSAGADPGWDRT